MVQSLPYLLGSLGVTIALSLSAFGACEGMSSCGTASILYAHIPAIVTYSYVSMIMISTIFFYGFILSIIIINKLSASYSLHSSIMHLTSSLIFGIIGLYSGKSMGRISSNSFRRIAKNTEFYMTFIISLASVEVTLVIGFLCSLLVIYKK